MRVLGVRVGATSGTGPVRLVYEEIVARNPAGTLRHHKACAIALYCIKADLEQRERLASNSHARPLFRYTARDHWSFLKNTALPDKVVVLFNYLIIIIYGRKLCNALRM